MAIVACKECARKVSDKAVHCPHCGVPIGWAPRQPRRVKSWLYGALIGVLLAWAAFATLWLTGTLPVPQPLIGVLGIGGSPVRTGTAADKTVPPMPRGASAPAAPAPQRVSRAVYRTSVEQLYQDYEANEVAIHSKIGDNPVRISGTVAEIHEDLGRPVVTLHTGSDNGADMVLTDDQRPAAAQLAKDDAVEIQCNEMQRMAARLHGSGCALVLVDAGAKLVYLAVALTGKAGNAPVYVVGPMSRMACLTSSDTVALQLTGNSTTDRIRSKSCAATPSDNLAREGCRLNSSMPAIPNLPSAHLWRYDCAAPDAEALSAKATSKAASKDAHRRAAAESAAVAAVPLPVSPDPASESSVAAPAATPEALPTVAAAGAQPSVKPVVEGPPASKRESNTSPDGGSTPAAVDAEAVRPRPLVVADAVSTSTTPAAPPAAADDLAPVRSRDPQAADRIVSYCDRFTSATNTSTVGIRCRRDEMDAWTRLTVQNEFPTLDETTRRKCSEPPFPNSFVALESCAKYQLHLD